MNSSTFFENFTGSPPADRINAEDIEDALNNSLSKDIFAQLPPARRFGSGDEGMCPILKTNNTLALLMPGWEGIPSNILVNIGLSVVSIKTNDKKTIEKSLNCFSFFRFFC